MDSLTTAYATIDFRLVRHAPGRRGKPDFSNAYRQIKAGDWLEWRYRGTESSALHPSYYWLVVTGDKGELLLQTPWASPSVKLTQELAEELSFTESSNRLRLTDFPEEMRWFAACHWAPMFLDNRNKGIYMSLDRFGASRTVITGARVPYKILDSQPLMRAFLLNVLYELVHPGKHEQRPAKAKKLSEDELAKFIREVERKAEKLGVS